jgi:hypothetical protein
MVCYKKTVGKTTTPDMDKVWRMQAQGAVNSAVDGWLRNRINGATGGVLQVNHNHGTTSGLNLNVNLSPETREYLSDVAVQVAASAVHLMLHSTVKGVIFTIVELLYKVCSSIMPVSASTLMTDYIWPFVEKVWKFVSGQPQTQASNGNPTAQRQSAQIGYETVGEILPLAAGIAGIVASLVVGKQLTASSAGLAEFKKWGDMSRSALAIKQGVSSMADLGSWIVDKVKELIMQHCPEWNIARGAEEACLKATQVPLAEHLRECAELTNPNNAVEVLRSDETAERLRIAVHRAVKIQLAVAAGKLVFSPSVGAAVEALRREIMKFSQEFRSAKSAAAKRATPFHISLVGKPGCGKSDVGHRMIYDVTNPKWMTAEIDRETDGPRAGLVTIYPRNAADSYWPNYRGQGCVFLDDFGQSAQDTPADSEYLALIFMMTGVAWMPRMAAVNDKGTLFTTRLVFSTTNSEYPTSLCVKNDQALWRRRNILMEVVADDTKSLDDISRYAYNFLEPCPKTAGERRYLAKDLTYTQAVAKCVKAMNAFYARDDATVGATTALGEEDELEVERQMAQLLEREIIFQGWIPESSDSEDSDEEEQEEGHRPCGDLSVCCCPPGENRNFEMALRKFPWESEVRDAFCMEEQEGLTSEYFLGTFDELSGKAKFAFRRALVCGDVRVDRLYIERRREEINAEAQERPILIFSYDEEEEGTMWIRMIYAWNFVKTEIAAGRSQYVVNEHVPPRNTLWRERLERQDAQVGEMGIREQELYDRQQRAYAMYEADLAVARGERLSRPEETVHDSLVADMALIVMEEEGTDRILEEEEKSRFGRYLDWCEAHGHRKLGWVVAGLSAAGLAFIGWKAYRWLSATEVDCTVTTSTGVKEMNVIIEKTFTGFVKSQMLNAVAVACAASAIAACGDVEGAARYFAEGMVSGDSRTRNARVTKAARMRMQGSTIDVAIDAFVSELRRRQAFPTEEAYLEFERLAREKVAIKLARMEQSAEGSSDFRSDDVARLLGEKNQCSVTVTRGGVRRIMNGIGIKGKLMLVPKHLFYGFTNEDVVPMQVMNGGQTHDHKLVYGTDIKEMAPGNVVLSEDICVVRLGAAAPSFKDILHHFSAEESVQSVKSTAAALVTRERTGGMWKQVIMANMELTGVHYGVTPTKTDEDEYLPTRWDYRAQTRAGSCGSALVAVNTRFDGVICGMHVAGIEDQERGSSAIITREWLIEQLNRAYPNYQSMQCAEDGVMMHHPVMGDVLYSEMTVEDPEMIGTTIVPEGRLAYDRTMKMRPERITAKSDIVKSPLFDMVVPHVTEPSVLTKGDQRLSEELRDDRDWSPLNEGAKKYSVATVPWNPFHIQRAYKLIVAALSCVQPKDIHTSVLTEEQAINGIPLAGYNRINGETSAGIPFKWWKPAGAKGKHFLFESVSETIVKIKDKFLRRQLDEAEGMILRGEMPFILSYSNLKDERRSLAKVASGSTRLFDCLPVHFNILCRKYFGAFVACMNQNATRLPSAVGLDPTGTAWTELEKRMTRIGSECVAGDYKAWDGKFGPDVMDKCVDVVNACMDKWFPGQDTDAIRFARRVLMACVIHLRTLYGNTVAMKIIGLPSGATFTADINGLGNWFYLLCAMQEIADEKKVQLDFDTLNEEYEATFYGDDHVWVFARKFVSLFTFNAFQKAFAAHNIVYTDALKKGGEQPDTIPFHEACSYLKRRWVPHPIRKGLMRAPIEKASIEELCNWMRRCDGVEAERAQMYENLRTAMREAYHHGNVYFNGLKEKINLGLGVLRDAEVKDIGSSRWSPLTSDYEAIDQEWLSAFY